MKRNLRSAAGYMAIAFILGQTFTILRGQQRLPNQIDPRIEGLTGSAVEDSMPVNGITLRFKPTDKQQAELEKLLEGQQNPSSPLYHAWLTPEQYGERFGLNPADYSKVRDWVAAQGFQVDYAAGSRSYISFSGTAGKVRKAFGAELQYYQVNGRRHFANASEVAIPNALEAVVYSIRGLSDLPEQHAGRIARRGGPSAGAAGLTPAELAAIYNLTPVYQQGISGAGQKIVVAGESGFDIEDVRKFREAMGLPPNDPKIVLIPGVADPGPTDAQGEALLDVEFAGGVAPGAGILYVYGPDVASAVEYAVDQNLAPVISYSFGACERLNTANWGWFRNVVQQAAVQGMTWVAASGDTGPAACESGLTDSPAANGISVNLPASVPEVTSVGGTEFAGLSGTYRVGRSFQDRGLAQSYIPEIAWNDTIAGKTLAASGGGASAVYPRPAWQTGPGVPHDNARHVPDISFTASRNHAPYVIFKDGDITTAGGTSASTPFFAGVLALLNEYAVKNGIQAQPGLGNINPQLYQLAQDTPGVFHDVIAGNNIVPCQSGSPDCTAGRYGYEAGQGYDQVTGLGSMDVARLFAAWSNGIPHPDPTTDVVLSVEPSPVYRESPDADGYEWYYTVVLNEIGGAPANVMTFTVDGEDLSDSINLAFTSVDLPAKGTISASLRSKDVEVPSDHVIAVGGINSNGKPWSRQITVRFLGEKSGAAMLLTSKPPVIAPLGQGDPNCSADHPFYRHLILKELNGTGVALNRFLAGGVDYTDQIARWFGSTQLPPLGTLHAGVCWASGSNPEALSYEVDGVDETGRTVQATLQGTVPFAAAGAANRPAERALTTPPSIQEADLIGSPMRSRPAPANRK